MKYTRQKKFIPIFQKMQMKRRGETFFAECMYSKMPVNVDQSYHCYKHRRAISINELWLENSREILMSVKRHIKT